MVVTGVGARAYAGDVLAGNDGWRGKRSNADENQHEARTPAQIVAVVVIVALILLVLGSLSGALIDSRGLN